MNYREVSIVVITLTFLDDIKLDLFPGNIDEFENHIKDIFYLLCKTQGLMQIRVVLELLLGYSSDELKQLNELKLLVLPHVFLFVDH